MNWKKLATKLSAAGFTSLGAALAGPAGAAVGARIADAIGVDPDPDSVARAYVNDPDVTIALRRLDAEEDEMVRAHFERVQESDLAAREREMERQSAEMAVARDAFQDHWLPPVLTVALLTMVAAFVVALFLIEPPAPNRDMVNFTLGAIFGWAGAAVAFWLGSSRGSAEKQAGIMTALRSAVK